MTRINLVNAVCTVAMLAAVPAFAQPQRPGGEMVSTTGVPNPEVKQPKTGTLAPQNNGANMTSMAPSSTMAPAPASTTAKTHVTHHAMKSSHPEHAMGGKTDTSQDAAIDRLNDQSYQAAAKGQMFAASASPTSMTKQSGSSSGTGTKPAPSGAMTNPTK